MQKKVPVRMCIACKEQKAKKEMLRIVKQKDETISLDFTGKKPGRGAYICDSKDCINKCVKNKLLNRAFEMNVSDETYQAILNEYDNKN